MTHWLRRRHRHTWTEIGPAGIYGHWVECSCGALDLVW